MTIVTLLSLTEKTLHRGSGTSILDTTYYNDSDSDELPLFADKGDSGILAEERTAPTYNGKVIYTVLQSILSVMENDLQLK